jgi:hypothetical protein
MSVSPKQFAKRFAPFGCHKVGDLGAGFEIWTTGWDAPFTLPVLSNGHYDQADCNRLTLTILQTMPPIWRIAIDVSGLRADVQALVTEIRQLRQSLTKGSS